MGILALRDEKITILEVRGPFLLILVLMLMGGPFVNFYVQILVLRLKNHRQNVGSILIRELEFD